MIAELVDRIHDSEEKIRTAICRVIGSLDYDTALNHIGVDTLRAIGGRTSDKKVCLLDWHFAVPTDRPEFCPSRGRPDTCQIMESLSAQHVSSPDEVLLRP